MMRIQRILVPVDFSLDAEQALGDAIGFAQTFQAQLTLLHVISIPVVTEINLSPYTTELEDNARQRLETYQRRATHAGLQVDIHIRHGDPVRCIVEITTDSPVDLVVMGTHGRTGMRHFLIGSVAERIVRLAPCPVLVTRCPQGEGSIPAGTLAFAF